MENICHVTRKTIRFVLNYYHFFFLNTPHFLGDPIEPPGVRVRRRVHRTVLLFFFCF